MLQILVGIKRVFHKNDIEQRESILLLLLSRSFVTLDFPKFTVACNFAGITSGIIRMMLLFHLKSGKQKPVLNCLG